MTLHTANEMFSDLLCRGVKSSMLSLASRREIRQSEQPIDQNSSTTENQFFEEVIEGGRLRVYSSHANTRATTRTSR